MKKLIPCLFLMCMLSTLMAQKGTIRGTVTEEGTGETMIWVNVNAVGADGLGTTTDLDGNFSLKLAEGTYTIEFSFISYATKRIENVSIKADEVTVLNVTMREETEVITEVVIQAKALRNKESALLTIQRKSANVLDGVSAQSFVKTGDGDAAAAVQRVTGVSIEGGKHVFIRGLGDRYTKTTLNGMEIPGLDPDKNSVQMDIFPTNLIDNITVYKTFTPNLPGDFTGGMVNIVTKDFPESKTSKISVGAAYNPQMNFKSNYLSYKGGNLDFLGIDDGNRVQPFSARLDIPDESRNDPLLESITRKLNPTMGVEEQMSFANGSFAYSFGNQKENEKSSLGYIAAINYRSQYELLNDFKVGSFKKDNDVTQNELAKFKFTDGTVGRFDALWSSLIGGSLKFEKHKFSMSLFHSQNGIKEASKQVQQDFEQTDAELVKDIATFTQRSVTNHLVSGKHQFEQFNIEWKNSTTLSLINDPDFRITAFSIREGDTTLQRGDGAQVTRFWRSLSEINQNFKADLEYPFMQWSDLKSKFKTGVYETFKTRDFTVNNYQFRNQNRTFSGDADELFESANIWTPEDNLGTFIVGNYEAANNFTASQQTYAAYAMVELPLTVQLKAVTGARVEQNNMFYTGENNDGTVVYQNEKTLSTLDILPSFGLIYNPVENMNVRLSGSRTLARPSFKEKSIAQIYDPISNTFFIGNIDLRQSYILNTDLRWEYFMRRGEIISVSLFGKQFTDPIERIAFELALNNIQPANVGTGYVYGGEVEIKKRLDFISDTVQTFSVGGNFTYVESRIDMAESIIDDEGTTELELRELTKRDGESIGRWRNMAGQSPFVLNTFINYSHKKSGINANISYNVQGKKLSIVGIGRAADVYEQDFHALNFKISKTLGAENNMSLSLNANNLLADNREWLYENHTAEPQIFRSFSVGRTFGLNFSYTFF